MRKILYITHQASFNKYGGAETQIVKTLKHINESNNKYHAKLFDMWCDNIDDYDIVHLFKPTAFPLESLQILKYAKERDISVAVSPIFYRSAPEKPTYSHIALQTMIKLKKTFPKFKAFSYIDPYRFSEFVLNNSDIILPNTCEELKLLNSFFNLPNKNSLIVPNGVEIDFKSGNSVLFKQVYGIDNFILFIGRIEQRKNVLSLIKSFVKSRLNTHLIIIGKKIDNAYYELCKRSSNEQVLFLPPIPHDSELLKSAYKAAKVLVLPSYYETPGLVALEGGLAGTNIVITKIGGTQEYFGKYAWYIDPSSEDSIKNAITDAYNTPKNNKLVRHIETKFTWNKVADATMKAYDTIIKE